MRVYNRLNTIGTEVLSTFLIVVLVSLLFGVIITQSSAGSFDGDHMQDATGTNTTATQQVLRKGWGYIRGNSNYAIADTIINYGITFDEVPFLVFNFANSRDVADGAPTDLSECTTTRTVIGSGINQTTTGFQPLLRTTAGTGFPPSIYFCYTWVAIGKDYETYSGWENGTGDDIYYTGDIAVGTTDADDHGINALNYVSGKAGVRGSDQVGSLVYAEGMLGALNGGNAFGLPVSVFNIGVLGIKPALGNPGAAIYGWTNDGNTSNYAGVFVADGTTTGINYGIYSKASGGTENYAGYFDGEVILAAGGRIGIGHTAPTADVHINQTYDTDYGPSGVRFEYGGNHWKIYNGEQHLSFAENGVRMALVEHGTGNYVTTSDGALKENILNLEANTLDKVLKLKPVTYNYIGQDSIEGKTYGFVAQEVEEVFPDLARKSEDGYLGLAYSNFGVLSIKAIQELKAEKDAEIRELKSIICDLKPEETICE